jgi:hypothetical protein
MLSSITVSTLSPLTMVSSLAAIGILVIFGSLVQKEFAGARSTNKRIQTISMVVAVIAGPLLIAFLLVLISKMYQVIR